MEAFKKVTGVKLKSMRSKRVESMDLYQVNKVLSEAVGHLAERELWSGKVKTKWKPPEGFFKQSAGKIASGLKSASKDLGQATSRLNFYIYRAGGNIPEPEMAKLQSAKKKLRKLYA